MARVTLVLDASVGVKWFSSPGEMELARALSIRDGHIKKSVEIVVPDLFFYEVANALVHKKTVPDQEIKTAMGDLFDLRLRVISINVEIMVSSIRLARDHGISVYDACYAAIARQHTISLVTANPKHQAKIPGCKVIPLEQWVPEES